MPTLPRYSFLFLTGLFLINIATAQTSRNWRKDRETHPSFESATHGLQATLHGRGSLGIKGPNRRLKLASVNLSRNGRAEFLFRGAQDYHFSGTWRQGRGNQLQITITRAFGRMRASGTGTVTLRRHSFSKVDLTGISASLGGSFNIQFQAGKQQGGGRNFSLDSTKRGQGSIGVRGPNKSINQARIILQRNGDARLILHGRNAYEFSGTWVKRDRNTVNLRITRGPDRRKMNTAGTVRLTRNGFSRLDLLGYAPSLGGQIRVSFNASNREHIDHGNTYRGRNIVLVGNGTMGMRGPNRRLRHASVSLYKNGQAILTFQGEKRYVLQATWFGSKNRGSLDFEIHRINNHPATGTGKLSLHNNGQAHGVECKGRSNATNGSFNISFQPEGH